MNICQDHWNRLRAAIEARGLLPLVHKGGEAAAEAQARELRGEADERDYDPLLAAHWAIMGNASRMLERNVSPLYFLSPDAPEDPVDPGMIRRARERGRDVPEGITWPRKCVLCYGNLTHKLTCLNDPRCELDTERGFDWMIDRAADDQLEAARKKGLVPGRQ